MTSVRIRQRPYTHPAIKNPTYPMVVDHQIVELSWEEEPTMNAMTQAAVLPKKSTEQFIAEAESLLPDWAISRARGQLVEGAQLPTKDGRRMGNAHILKIVPGIAGVPSLNYLILTDAGNTIVMSENEIEAQFYPPEYVGEVKAILRKFWRHEDFPVDLYMAEQGITA